ncbi:MAG TPA: hypothetical protein VFU14_10520 [Acidimicrobiales bacterium]|nr:hypothetical protein [Acidimicrobiales bacterium]
MRLPRPLLGVVAAVLLAGGAAATEPDDAAPPEPPVWDDGVRPEPRALDARVGAGCATEPSIATDPLVAAPGTVATGVDAMCTWQAPHGGGGTGSEAVLQ